MALACLAIFIVGLGIRLPGIGWGLKNEFHNQSYHPDEPLIFDFSHHTNLYGEPNEHQYYNYGTLYYAVLRTAEAVGVATGKVTPPSVLLPYTEATSQQWDEANTYSSQSILAGRHASAIAGAATASLIFLILCQWTTFIGALAGAAVIAFSPAHVEHSRFQTVDIVSLFFVTLATWACLRMLRGGLKDSKQWMIDVCIAATLAGCAASTRYSDILMVFSVWAVLIIRRPQRWITMALIAGVVAVVAFCITTPGSITDTQYFLENQQFQAAHANEGHGLVFAGRPSGFIFHIYEMIVGIGALPVILGLAGLGYAAVKRHAWAWVALAYFIPYFITIGILHVMFLRYDFPLYLGVAVGFGYVISAIQSRVQSPSAARLAAIGIAFLCLIGIESEQSGIRGAALFTKWMTSTDPRDEAAQHVKDLARQIPNMDIGFVGESPWFFTAPVIKDADYLQFHPAEAPAYLAKTQSPKVLSLMSGELPMFVTIGSYQIEDGQRLKDRTDLDPDDAKNVATNVAMFNALNRIYNVDQVYGEGGPTLHDLEYIRPTIWIYKRKDLP